MATSGPAVRFRRLRRRFGIGAPKLAIRTHIAWYWQVLALVAILSISLSLAMWIYDSQRQVYGATNEAQVREIQTLRSQVVELDAELAKMRSAVDTGENSLQIERATQRQLSQQVRSLEAENAALKEDLAFFEGLTQVSGEVQDSVRVERFRVEPGTVAGVYKYRLLVVNNSGRSLRSSRVDLQFVVKMRQGGRDVVVVVFPSEPESAMQQALGVRNFHRIEGEFVVPSDAEVLLVEVKLLQDGSVRAKQSVTL
ncbi:MAG: hypothetical protein QM739_03110 [Propionivibrio sp.]